MGQTSKFEMNSHMPGVVTEKPKKPKKGWWVFFQRMSCLLVANNGNYYLVMDG